LNQAFVHRSLSNEAGSAQNNERLEFLGDSILGCVTAYLLYEMLPDLQEGKLAKIKSVVVSEETLSGIALELQIDNYLLLGNGEEMSGGRQKKAILADAVEALLGALFLDGGYKTAFRFVKKLIEPEIQKVLKSEFIKDYKSILQETCQKRYKNHPQYKILKRSGPEHDKYFWIEVIVNGKSYGPCMGHNKKSAEQDCAKIALESLGII
jgi:ribonuclease-3